MVIVSMHGHSIFGLGLCQLEYEIFYVVRKIITYDVNYFDVQGKLFYVWRKLFCYQISVQFERTDKI